MNEQNKDYTFIVHPNKWHGTTISENLYQRIAQLALEHKRSVMKEIEYLIEKGLLWLESEDQV